MATAVRTANFISTIGVNTHIPYTDGGYANIANVEADIAFLGIDNVRDSITNGANGSAPLSSYISLAQSGVKFTFLIASGGAVTTASMNATLSLIAQVDKAVPGSVLAVEGANEINNFPLTFNRVGGLTGAVNLQKALYSAVKANKSLPGVKVDYFTGYNAGSIAVGPNPATTSGLANYDNQHPYPNGGLAPEAFVAPSAALGNEKAPYGPAVYTETGYSTDNVSQDVQAKYTLDLLMDDMKNGIAQTYLYQLMDAYAPGSPQGDDGYGLFDPNNAPKEAATAIHNMVAVLSDTGSTSTTFATGSLAYTITGLPATGNSLLMEKSSGAFDVVVWNEPQIWNSTSNTEISIAATNVTVNLGATYGTVNVFDPLSSSSSIETLSNVSSVSLSLTDHPLILEVEPAVVGSIVVPGGLSVPSGSVTPVPSGSVTPAPSGSDTLVLNVADVPAGGVDAQFTVSVDGTQIGGVQTASASETAGGGQNITLTGNFGAAGPHDVTINYLNGYAGSAADAGRMLFVNAISVDGLTSFPDLTMQYPGSSDATVLKPATPMPSDAGSHDTLWLNLSETAMSGQDALFMVSIDGQLVGGIQSVTASHANVQDQAFEFTGNFGRGSHQVAIDFVNGYAGNPADAGRTLYVNDISYNNHTVYPSSGQFYAGAQSYTV
jgi:hypothetical protein